MTTNLVRILTGRVQEEALPFHLTERWPQWVFEDARLIPVPMQSPQTEWLNPRSLDALWIPAGQPPLSCRAALQVLLQSGRPRYVMPSIDLRLTVNTKDWRNRGLKTYPVARTWQPFGGVELHRLMLSVFKKSKTDEWQTLSSGLRLAPCLQHLAELLAQGPQELASGFHFVNLPVADLSDSPAPKERWRVCLNAQSSPPAQGEDGSDPIGGLLDVLVEGVEGFADSLAVPPPYTPLVSHFASRS